MAQGHFFLALPQGVGVDFHMFHVRGRDFPNPAKDIFCLCILRALIVRFAELGEYPGCIALRLGNGHEGFYRLCRVIPSDVPIPRPNAVEQTE